MSVTAVTLSNRTQWIRATVCDIYPFPMAVVNVRFLGMRILKNTGSLVDKKIEDFRTTFLELHKAFMDEANITTEITALQILDDVGIISAKVGAISMQFNATQLNWVSSQVSDAGTQS
jgi:hypothetical protein